MQLIKRKVLKREQKSNELLKDHGFSIDASEEVLKWYNVFEENRLKNF